MPQTMGLGRDEEAPVHERRPRYPVSLATVWRSYWPMCKRPLDLALFEPVVPPQGKRPTAWDGTEEDAQARKKNGSCVPGGS